MSKFIFLFIFLFSINVFAVSETQIKAVFLEKFTHLIEWPKDNNEDFLVCILQDGEFSKALKDIYASKTFKNKKVSILDIKDKNKIPNCQLLFIGKETEEIDKVISRIQDRAILTVSDDNTKTTHLVMINMFLQKNRFKYVINNKAAQKSKIKISHLLLRSAQEVIK